MQTRICLEPVAGIELLSSRTTLMGLGRGVNWRNQWRWEHMMQDAPESMSHMSNSVLSDRSEWDVYADSVGSSSAVEAWKRWMTLSCTVATLAFTLDDFPLEPEFAFGALEDLFLSSSSFFFIQHSKTSCPVLLQWVHFSLLSHS